MIQPNDVRDDLGREPETTIGIARQAHVRHPATHHPRRQPDNATAADEADLLCRQLVSRAEIRAAAEWLDRRPQLNREVFPRGHGEAQVSEERVGDITALLRACLAALSLPEGAQAYPPHPPPAWRVSDAIGRILARLDRVPEEGASLSAFLPPIAVAEPERESWRRVAVAATFLAGLELARDGQIRLDQPQPWDGIQLQRPAARPGRF